MELFLRFLQQLESMRPFIPKKPRNAPEHTKRFNRAGRLGFAHISRFPTELIENSANGALGRIIVAANEHRGFTSGKLRIHHAGIPNRIERFDESKIAKFSLQ